VRITTTTMRGSDVRIRKAEYRPADSVGRCPERRSHLLNPNVPQAALKRRTIVAVAVVN